MAKYYDIYTQIPGIEPCPQVWVVEEDRLDVINQLLKKRNFIDVKNIVATDVKALSNTKTIKGSEIMNLYEVMPVFASIEGDEYHLVLATSEKQAIGMVVNRVNYRHNYRQSTFHYGISDFYANEINTDFPEPRIIY